MAASTSSRAGAAAMNARNEAPAWVRFLLLLSALAFVALLLLLPALNVLAEAFSKGLAPYLAALANADTLHALVLTSGVSVVAMAVNTVFGVAASWAITKYEFWGKSFLVTLI